jgi:hypothetical protein
MPEAAQALAEPKAARMAKTKVRFERKANTNRAIQTQITLVLPFKSDSKSGG